MSSDSTPDDPRPQENPWLVFAVVAAVLLGALLVISRVVAAGTPESLVLTHSIPIVTEVQLDDPRLAGTLNAPRSAATHTEGGDQQARTEPAPAPTEAPPSQPPQAEVRSEPPAPEPPPAEAPPQVQAPAQEPAPAPPPPPPPRITAPAPRLSATTVAVVERACGTLIWGLDEHRAMAPASLTKVISALVAVEAADLNTILTSSISATQLARRTGSSTMGLEPGMRVTVRDLVYGLMLPSGNDAAIMLADHIGGGVPGFVALMNLKAQQLGMRSTHFSNPHGLDEAGIFSTTFDMALAGLAYLDNPLLAEIAAAPGWRTMSGLNLKNGNRLLQLYPGSYGVKIGFTLAAKQTFVGAAERDGRHILISFFGSEDRYGDAAKLFDWAFAHTEPPCR
jgi:D-alanyl-D-alanine carboxypeptidase